MQKHILLPFSVYSSVKEQHIFNIPVIKPLLVCILDGRKQLGKNGEISCPAGEFIFLSNSPSVEMRNIPNDTEYFSLLIEFDFDDFNCFSPKVAGKESFFSGKIDTVFQQALLQFVEWSTFAPQNMWSIRKQEILQLIYHLGYKQVISIAEQQSMSHKLHGIISANIDNSVNVADLSTRLAMSESTLRRKLKAEGTSIQAIKDRAKLGRGLHLIQSSADPVGRIAERCGYQSQSRFTSKFKKLFGVTPTDLRKTRIYDKRNSA